MAGASRLVAVISCATAVGAMVYGLVVPRQPAGVSPPATASPVLFVGPSTGAALSTPTPEPGRASSPPARRIGIVASHSGGNDTGAVCPDGLTEVEINLDVARRVAHTLQDLGYQVELLEEFDARLEGYRADALVSIHADSCEDYPDATPPASGFKVASVEDSLVPDVEARLVACLAQCYAARTGMYFHANSITYDMTRYHTFYEIDGQTPAAIIETGFMRKDRDVLTGQTDQVAQGIVDGIICFLDEGP
jgi:N-acetylmuramoyl-L-alanine amidase